MYREVCYNNFVKHLGINMKDFDYWMERTASEGKLFGVDDEDIDVGYPTAEELEEIKELEKKLRDKGYVIK